MSNCNQTPECIESKGCSTTTYQLANVSLPITVKPNVNTGETKTFCCGEPVIKPRECTLRCSGKNNGVCSYTISQNICIEVPIEFSAVTCVGAPCVECGIVTGEDCCHECGK